MNNKSPIYYVVLQLCQGHPERDLLLNDKGEPNQNELFRRTGIHQPTLQRIFSGESKDPRDSTLEPLANLFNISISQLKGRESLGNSDRAEDRRVGSTIKPDSIDVPVMDVVGSMGSGVLAPDHDTVIGSIRLSMQFIRLNLPVISRPDALRITTGQGDSMLPTFRDGDPLIVDTGITSVQTEGVYMYLRGEELFIKRLQRLGHGKIKIISDNRKLYDPEVIEREEAENLIILARVLYAWRGERL